MKKAIVAAVVGIVLVVALDVAITSARHNSAVHTEEAALMSAASRHGLTDFGQAQLVGTKAILPIDIPVTLPTRGPVTCEVNGVFVDPKTAERPGGSFVLTFPLYDGMGRLISATGGEITDAASQAATVKSMASLIASDPNTQVC
jgi:hypothetical protein